MVGFLFLAGSGKIACMMNYLQEVMKGLEGRWQGRKGLTGARLQFLTTGPPLPVAGLIQACSDHIRVNPGKSE